VTITRNELHRYSAQCCYVNKRRAHSDSTLILPFTISFLPGVGFHPFSYSVGNGGFCCKDKADGA
jgi:hypothetical protein